MIKIEHQPNKVILISEEDDFGTEDTVIDFELPDLDWLDSMSIEEVHGQV